MRGCGYVQHNSTCPTPFRLSFFHRPKGPAARTVEQKQKRSRTSILLPRRKPYDKRRTQNNLGYSPGTGKALSGTGTAVPNSNTVAAVAASPELNF
jgi:hypothetical protein